MKAAKQKNSIKYTPGIISRCEKDGFDIQLHLNVQRIFQPITDKVPKQNGDLASTKEM